MVFCACFKGLPQPQGELEAELPSTADGDKRPVAHHLQLSGAVAGSALSGVGLKYEERVSGAHQLGEAGDDTATTSCYQDMLLALCADLGSLDGHPERARQLCDCVQASTSAAVVRLFGATSIDDDEGCDSSAAAGSGVAAAASRPPMHSTAAQLPAPVLVQLAASSAAAFAAAEHTHSLSRQNSLEAATVTSAHSEALVAAVVEASAAAIATPTLLPGLVCHQINTDTTAGQATTSSSNAAFTPVVAAAASILNSRAAAGAFKGAQTAAASGAGQQPPSLLARCIATRRPAVFVFSPPSSYGNADQLRETPAANLLPPECARELVELPALQHLLVQSEEEAAAAAAEPAGALEFSFVALPLTQGRRLLGALWLVLDTRRPASAASGTPAKVPATASRSPAPTPAALAAVATATARVQLRPQPRQPTRSPAADGASLRRRALVRAPSALQQLALAASMALAPTPQEAEYVLWLAGALHELATAPSLRALVAGVCGAVGQHVRRRCLVDLAAVQSALVPSADSAVGFWLAPDARAAPSSVAAAVQQGVLVSTAAAATAAGAAGPAGTAVASMPGGMGHAAQQLQQQQQQQQQAIALQAVLGLHSAGPTAGEGSGGDGGLGGNSGMGALRGSSYGLMGGAWPALANAVAPPADSRGCWSPGGYPGSVPLRAPEMPLRRTASLATIFRAPHGFEAAAALAATAAAASCISSSNAARYVAAAGSSGRAVAVESLLPMAAANRSGGGAASVAGGGAPAGGGASLLDSEVMCGFDSPAVTTSSPAVHRALSQLEARYQQTAGSATGYGYAGSSVDGGAAGAALPVLSAKAFPLSHTLLQLVVGGGGAQGDGDASSGRVLAAVKEASLLPADTAGPYRLGGQVAGVLVPDTARHMSDVRQPNRDVCMLQRLVGKSRKAAANTPVPHSPRAPAAGGCDGGVNRSSTQDASGSSRFLHLQSPGGGIRRLGSGVPAGAAQLAGANSGTLASSGSSAFSLALFGVEVAEGGCTLGLYLAFPSLMPAPLLDAAYGSCGKLLGEVLAGVIRCRLQLADLGAEFQTLCSGVPGSYVTLAPPGLLPPASAGSPLSSAGAALLARASQSDRGMLSTAGGGGGRSGPVVAVVEVSARANSAAAAPAGVASARLVDAAAPVANTTTDALPGLLCAGAVAAFGSTFIPTAAAGEHSASAGSAGTATAEALLRRLSVSTAQVAASTPPRLHHPAPASYADSAAANATTGSSNAVSPPLAVRASKGIVTAPCGTPAHAEPPQSPPPRTPSVLQLLLASQDRSVAAGAPAYTDPGAGVNALRGVAISRPLAARAAGSAVFESTNTSNAQSATPNCSSAQQEDRHTLLTTSIPTDRTTGNASTNTNTHRNTNTSTTKSSATTHSTTRMAAALGVRALGPASLVSAGQLSAANQMWEGDEAEGNRTPALMTVRNLDDTWSMRSLMDTLVEGIMTNIKRSVNTAATATTAAADDPDPYDTLDPLDPGRGTDAGEAYESGAAACEGLEELQLYEVLGHGGSGVVLRGLLGTVPVAVKVMEMPDESAAAGLGEQEHSQHTAAAGAADGSGRAKSTVRVGSTSVPERALSLVGSSSAAGGDAAAAGSGAIPAAAAAATASSESQQLREREDMLRNATELAVMRTVQHVHIVQVHAVYDNVIMTRPPGTDAAAGFVLRKFDPVSNNSDGSPICFAIVQELCDCGSLADALDRRAFPYRKQLQGAVAGVSAAAAAREAEAATAAAKGYRPAALHPSEMDMKGVYLTLLEIALALRHLHSRRLVHRDLKPDNILLKSSPGDPRGWTCKLADFGFALVLDQRDAARAPEPAGTPPAHSRDALALPLVSRYDSLTSSTARTFTAASAGRPRAAASIGGTADGFAGDSIGGGPAIAESPGGPAGEVPFGTGGVTRSNHAAASGPGGGEGGGVWGRGGAGGPGASLQAPHSPKFLQAASSSAGGGGASTGLGAGLGFGGGGVTSPADGWYAVQNQASGTCTHQAPEALHADARINAAIDVFAFGVIAWELVCGRGYRPYRDVEVADIPAAVAGGLRPEFTKDVALPYRRMAQSCMSSDPRQRPRAAELVAFIKIQLAQLQQQDTRLRQQH